MTAPIPGRRLADRYLDEGEAIAGEFVNADRLDPDRPTLSMIVAQVIVQAEERGREEALRPFRELFSGGPDTTCRTRWRDESSSLDPFPNHVECVEVPLDDLRAAFTEAGDSPS